MLGFYGCARKHRINFLNKSVYLVYNDIEKRFFCDITCDVRNVLKSDYINNFDFYIFTPPCNYYSHANYRRDTSIVAQETKDLLPLCLDFCVASNKPFIVENVCNKTLLGGMYPEYQVILGGHTYWTNINLNISGLKKLMVKQNKQYCSRNQRDGNKNVDYVIKHFLLTLVRNNQVK